MKLPSGKMARRCEICASLPEDARPNRAGTRRLRRLLLEDRLVVLCDEHANCVREHAVETLREARALFAESVGKRSLLGRRAPLDRRMFPARPEGRRASSGRRATDADP
jgi:hypothetical protein